MFWGQVVREEWINDEESTKDWQEEKTQNDFEEMAEEMAMA